MAGESAPGERASTAPTEPVADVVVVGSLNEDLVVRVAAAPGPGETVLGDGHTSGLGGKGANQAVAAARLGATTAMVGRLGSDDVAARFRESLAADGVDLAHVTYDEGERSGLAVIVVEASGENRIVVSAGANGRLSPAHVAPAGDALERSAVVLAQLEVPVEAVSAAFGAARGVRILNAAPARSLPADLLELVDVLVVNETELAAVAGHTGPVTEADVVPLARGIGVGAVVVTLGARGCVVVHADPSHLPASRGAEPSHLPAPEVPVVDTTAAGDCFCGALAASLAAGEDLVEAARFATRAAAVAVTRAGAIESLPTRSELGRCDGSTLT